MENISLPSKIEVQDTKEKNKSIISIQPCHPGYGTTLGNGLRRVLLSSLPGGAVIAFKIDGSSHEFSTIDNVKEDIVEISQNLKQLRLKIFTDEPVKIELKTKGEKKVTAKDIKATSDVEVVNPELLIATLTDKNAELSMEIIVTNGRGYVPSESREKGELEVGMIVIDSIFTPIKSVGFQVENVRVGKITNFENLILTIQTDGTVTPQEALHQSVEILLNQYNQIATETKSVAKPKKVKKVKKEVKIKVEEVQETAEEDNKTETPEVKVKVEKKTKKVAQEAKKEKEEKEKEKEPKEEIKEEEKEVKEIKKEAEEEA